MTTDFRSITINKTNNLRLYLDSLIDSEAGLVFKLSDDKENIRVEISFTDHIGYLNLNESYLAWYIKEHPELSTEGSFFEVINKECSLFGTTLRHAKLMHDSLRVYLLATPEDVVEIVSLSPPFILQESV